MFDTDCLAALGPFFAVSAHRAEPSAPWRRMDELTTDPAALDRRIEQVRRGLSRTAGTRAEDVELRTAASVAQLGLVARLVAPLLGAAVLGADVLGADVRGADVRAVELRQVFWQPELGGPFPLSFPSDTWDGESRPAPFGAVVDGPVAAITETTASRSSLSPHVLWGNVASAVHTAGTLIASARPDLTSQVDAILADVMTHPLLVAEHREVDGRFRRRSCCLIYRIAPAGGAALCGDCALQNADRR